MSIRSEVRHRARGSTLIEVLIAGAILAIGMTAIAAMLNESVFSSRIALRKTEASEIGVSTIERLAASGYGSLTPGIYDGGRYTDDAGTLLYQTTYIVDAGGMPAGSYYLQVDVSFVTYQMGVLPKTRVQTYTTAVSDPNEIAP